MLHTHVYIHPYTDLLYLDEVGGGGVRLDPLLRLARVVLAGVGQQRLLQVLLVALLGLPCLFVAVYGRLGGC